MRDKALEDFYLSSKRISALLYLAWYKTRSKYQRTLLGPLWLVLSTGVTVIGMGVVWSLLFKMDVKEFFPYLAAGLITWNLILAIVTLSPELFIVFSSMVTSTANPKFVYIYVFVLEQFIVFFHNVLIFVIIAVFCQVKINFYILWFPLSVFVLFVNALGVSTILGLLGPRFRDLSPIITSSITLLFFLTPVMWKPEQLGSRGFYMLFNPFSSYIAMIRNPLLGEPVPFINICIVGFCTLTVLWLAYLCFKKCRSRIVYWL